MMTKNKSKQIKKAKYLLLVPVLAGMLFYTSCSNNDAENDVLLTEKKQSQVPQIDKIPFVLLDEKPSFIGLDAQEDVSFDKQLKKFVARNFDATDLGLKSNKYRIYAAFSIDDTGLVKDVRVRTRDAKLSDEMKRVLSLLPNVKPGIKEGKPVSTRYVLPISFKIE